MKDSQTGETVKAIVHKDCFDKLNKIDLLYEDQTFESD